MKLRNRVHTFRVGDLCGHFHNVPVDETIGQHPNVQYFRGTSRSKDLFITKFKSHKWTLALRSERVCKGVVNPLRASSAEPWY